MYINVDFCPLEIGKLVENRGFSLSTRERQIRAIPRHCAIQLRFGRSMTVLPR